MRNKGSAIIINNIIKGKLIYTKHRVVFRRPFNNLSGSSCNFEKIGNVTCPTMVVRV